MIPTKDARSHTHTNPTRASYGYRDGLAVVGPAVVVFIIEEIFSRSVIIHSNHQGDYPM